MRRQPFWHEQAPHLPRMLMANTLRPPMDSTPMMVSTHSYKMAFPAFRAPSVLVATCARMSLIASLALHRLPPVSAAASAPAKAPLQSEMSPSEGIASQSNL